MTTHNSEPIMENHSGLKVSVNDESDSSMDFEDRKSMKFGGSSRNSSNFGDMKLAHKGQESFFKKNKIKLLIFAAITIVVIIIIIAATKHKQDIHIFDSVTTIWNPYKFDQSSIVTQVTLMTGFLIADPAETKAPTEYELNELKKLENEDHTIPNPRKVATGLNNQLIKNVSFELGFYGPDAAYLIMEDAAKAKYEHQVAYMKKNSKDVTWGDLGLKINQDKFGFEINDLSSGKSYV